MTKADEFFPTDADGWYPEEVVDLVGGVNDALCDWVLDALAAKGYRAKRVMRGDTYFVFSGFPCSIVEFRLSRVWPGWRFGIWLHGEELLCDSGDEARVIQLFCQHDTQVDKFKPSASDMLVEIYKGELLDMLGRGAWTRSDGVVVRPWAERHVQALADQIRMHPFLSYEGVKGWMPIDYRPTANAVRWMVGERKRQAKRRLSHTYWLIWAKCRVERANGMPYVTDCRLVDYGERTWPRLEVFCTLKDDPSDENLDEMWDLWRLDDGCDHEWGDTRLRVSVLFESEGRECQLY